MCFAPRPASQVLIDVNQDKRFTLEEFLEAAKAAKEDEAAAVQRSGPELNDVLRRVSAYIKDDAVGSGDKLLVPEEEVVWSQYDAVGGRSTNATVMSGLGSQRFRVKGGL